MSIKAIDISFCQKDIDFRKVKQSGIEAVIIRAGFGREVSQKDSQFENHYKGAKAVGLKIGAYWYSYADSSSDAITEAKACLAVLNHRALDLPVYYDLEDPSQLRYSRATLTQFAENFCETIKSGGYRAGVYACTGWFDYFLNYSQLVSKYSIWLAQWGVGQPYYACDIWQYSDKGRVDGISGNADLDSIENTDILNGTDFGIQIPDTATVQRWLNKVYYYNLVVDNIYGPATRKAIIKGLQNVLNVKYHANLVVDGIFGKATKAAVRPCKRGMYGGYPSILQAFLICRGFDTGGFDGDFGLRTESAVKTFQQNNGLKVTGIADANTFAKLAE